MTTRQLIDRHQHIQVSFWCAFTAYWSIFISAVGSQFDIPFFRYSYLVYMACVSLVLLTCVLEIGRKGAALKTNFSVTSGQDLAASTYITALLLFTLTLTALAPGSSWDFLSYWAMETVSAISQSHQGDLVEFPFEREKHPWAISGAVASALSIGPALGPPGVFWFGLLAASLACIKAMASTLELGPTSVLIAFLVFFVPLVENHHANFGYAEAALALGVNLFVVCTHFAYKFRSFTQFLLAILIALSLTIIKTSGFIFCLICLCALALSALATKIQKHQIVLFLFLGLCVATIMSTFFLDGMTLAALKTGTLIRPRSASILMEVFTQAFVHNSSFSIMALLFIACVGYLAPRLDHLTVSSTLLCILCILFATIAVGVLFTFTEYGFGHSAPDHDTSFSRLFTVFPGPLAFILLISLREASVASVARG